MKEYWVTDLGQNLELRADDGSAPRVIGRYGAWEDQRGKPQCIDCSDDLEGLRAKYGLAQDEPVYSIGTGKP